MSKIPQKEVCRGENHHSQSIGVVVLPEHKLAELQYEPAPFPRFGEQQLNRTLVHASVSLIYPRS